MENLIRRGSNGVEVGLRLIAAGGLAWLAGCTPGTVWQHVLGPEHALSGRIYQPATERFVDQTTMLADLAEADFVLLGERHGNPEHHRIQAQLTRALVATDGRPRVVAFEMVAGDRQLAIVEYRQIHPDDAAGLGAALDWRASGWPQWSLYQPIAQAAMDAGAEIVAADLSRAQSAAVFHQGPAVLSAPMVRRTGLDQSLPPPLAARLVQELRAAHCGQVPEPLVEGMFRVQRARDAMMADRLATVAGRAGGVLIAGNGHVRNDWGVPWYLARIRPTARTLSVGLIEVQEGTAAAMAELPFDYVWFTPAVAEKDPCAGVEQPLLAPVLRD